jgi:hypothetical protein
MGALPCVRLVCVCVLRHTASEELCLAQRNANTVCSETSSHPATGTHENQQNGSELFGGLTSVLVLGVGAAAPSSVRSRATLPPSIALLQYCARPTRQTPVQSPRSPLVPWCCAHAVREQVPWRASEENVTVSGTRKQSSNVEQGLELHTRRVPARRYSYE